MRYIVEFHTEAEEEKVEEVVMEMLDGLPGSIVAVRSRKCAVEEKSIVENWADGARELNDYVATLRRKK